MSAFTQDFIIQPAGRKKHKTGAMDVPARLWNPDGTPFTAHTTNPVPFLVAGCGNVELRAGGCLADIAPTMLPYIGLPVPKEMTGKSIIED